jgi:hypothetical protein
MRFIEKKKKWISLVMAWAFIYMLQISTLPLRAEKNGAPAGSEVSRVDNTSGAIEMPGDAPTIVKKKHFPWLWVIAGVVVAGGVAYLLITANQKYTLTVNKDAGVNGTPDSGSSQYKKGTTVNYNFTLKPGYKDLKVTLDNAPVAASGTVTMKGNHTLSASATVKPKQYTLTVSTDSGVDGTPATGTYNYDQGQTVNYSYTAKSGYGNLVVKLDSSAIAATGTVTMNNNHKITVTTNAKTAVTIVLHDVIGIPAAGTYYYDTGKTVFIDYAYQASFNKSMICQMYIDATLQRSVTNVSEINGTMTLVMSNSHTLSVYGYRGSIPGTWKVQETYGSLVYNYKYVFAGELGGGHVNVDNGAYGTYYVNGEQILIQLTDGYILRGTFDMSTSCSGDIYYNEIKTGTFIGYKQ